MAEGLAKANGDDPSILCMIYSFFLVLLSAISTVMNRVISYATKYAVDAQIDDSVLPGGLAFFLV